MKDLSKIEYSDFLKIKSVLKRFVNDFFNFPNVKTLVLLDPKWGYNMGNMTLDISVKISGKVPDNSILQKQMDNCKSAFENNFNISPRLKFEIAPVSKVSSSMNWYKRAQTEEDDLLGESFNEVMEESKPVNSPAPVVKESPLPLTDGVKRYFLKEMYSSPKQLAKIEVMTMLDPVDGPVTEFKTASATMAVSGDGTKLQMLLRKMGYDVEIGSVIDIKVYGKVKVYMQIDVNAPIGSDVEALRKKFWTKDEKLTGAVMKPRPWGKK